MTAQASVAHGTHEWVIAEAERIKAAGESTPRTGRDPVNQPMVNNWVEAVGDTNPVYVDADAAAASVHGGPVAPPAMAQVWTMGGLHPRRDPGDPLYATMAVLGEAGFTSVIATNSEQSYRRYLRLGEEVTISTRLESVVGPKTTGVGEGYFVTTRSTWRVGEEVVATGLFRVLKFRPPRSVPEPVAADQEQTDAAAFVIRPMVNRDSAFFWEGTQQGELRIQRCSACHLLRHPPGPACPRCGATSPDHVVATGAGSLYSYVVHRHPPVPGRTLPIVLGLVELDEGVRMVGELLDVDEDEVEIGMLVTVAMVPVDDGLTLPAWRPATGGGR